MPRETPGPLKREAVTFAVAQATKQPFWELGIAEVRREYRNESLAACGDPEPVASVEPIDADGVPARLYRPNGGEDHVLVWLHGGAWIVGDLDTEDALVRRLARRTECAVLSVDYRLAPEHRYPAAHEDAWAATTWAVGEFGAVAVGGDSAGGNLTASVALRARDRDVPLALQLLIYPMLDHRVDSPLYEEYARRYQRFAGVEGFGTRSREGIRHVWNGYVPDTWRCSEPDASPLRAASLADVAPAMIITAEHDILRREAEDYARDLKAAGVPVESITYEGQVHGFYRLLGVMSDATDATNRSSAALRRAFSRSVLGPAHGC